MSHSRSLVPCCGRFALAEAYALSMSPTHMKGHVRSAYQELRLSFQSDIRSNDEKSYRYVYLDDSLSVRFDNHVFTVAKRPVSTTAF